MTTTKSGITLVILAAGTGTRFGGLKQLEPLSPEGNVLLEYSIYDAIQAGFDKVVLVIRKEYINEFTRTLADMSKEVKIEYVFQEQPEGVCLDRSKPWGTANALLAARDVVNEPFALCNADDYYGRSAFRKAADFILVPSSDANRYGMLAYALRSTLPSQGAVSRGLCNRTESGNLKSIVEHENILDLGDQIISKNAHGEMCTLNESDIASMNFWLFGPTIFPRLQISFESFIEQYGQDPSAEFQLPTVIGEWLGRDEITVNCVPHNDTWFGLTHKEDRDRAIRAIQQMHVAGDYPKNLWRTEANNR